MTQQTGGPRSGHGEYKIPGGKLVVVDLRVRDGRLAQVSVSGDFFLEPPEALDRINAALEGLAADTDAQALARAVQAALPADAQMFGLTPEGIAVVIQRALA
ncbi:biotin--protein ligase [Castellaniella hirudinis]|uniref:biotin--protein ligase n=1 Tax=Castellaniella hirudinis TaxID=1144617 RepID=UPI0039C3E2B5